MRIQIRVAQNSQGKPQTLSLPAIRLAKNAIHSLKYHQGLGLTYVQFSLFHFTANFVR